MGIGKNLYQKARQIIPGGTMLLSKRPEMFLPDQWPCYFDKASGCQITDIDGNEYLDMSLMGVGTNTLGYGNDFVDSQVRSVIEKGNMSTLNCPEEVKLAEQLIELHPWADMVRLARTGGEANAIAIRIARAACGKDKVAICGYHGWHDWYLSANLKNDNNLKDHLLPGLEPSGVPRDLKDSIIPFTYNNIKELKKIVSDNPDLGIVKMEVARTYEPAKGFLNEVRRICNKKNLVLVFDECTSGFRETFGGLHKKYHIEPDLCVFGKALGNGYAITSVIGKKSIMEAAQRSFISSTFWTERIGPTAALATLKEMDRVKSWEIITKIGKRITKQWEVFGSKYGLDLKTSGLFALTSFAIESSDWLKYRTYITQEMLANGFLATNSVYVSTTHEAKILDAYFEKLEPLLADVADFEKGKRNIDEYLKGPVCHSGFKRLN